MTKPNLIAYIHAPISPGIKGFHDMMFNTLRCLNKEYEIYVLSRTKECYDYYKSDFQPNNSYMHLIEVPDNMTDSTYQFGLVEDNIDKIGHIDKVFWFFPGLKAVTPESRIKETYDNLISGKWKNQKVDIKDKIDGAVVQQAEMLYAIIKHKPDFIYRVGDYTEPHIEKIIDYPMRMFCFHDSIEKNHKKIHDTELSFFSDKLDNLDDKTYDFVFGYTVEIPERAYLSDFCFTYVQQNDKVKLYVKDKYFSRYAPINTQIQSTEYRDKLKHAKFTLIAPSTDPNELSLIRLYEALCRKCIPIFMKNVKYETCLDEETCNVMKELVYDEEKHETVNDFIKNLDYNEFYNRIMNCKMFKNYNKEWLENKVLEEIR